MRSLVTLKGENCQWRMVFEAYFINCWCGVVLVVNIFVFSNVSFFLGGGGVQGKGLGSPAKEKWEAYTEYFVIVQSKGDTICIYLYCIYVHWLFVWHYLLPVLWLNIVLMFMYFTLLFVFCLFCLSFLVFFFFPLLHGLLLLLSNKMTQLLLVSV